MRRFCLGLLLIAILVICVVVVVLAWITLAGEPNEIRAEATLDRSVVQPNDTFVLTVELENVNLDPVTIQAVGLEEELLNGARVVDVQPVFRAAEQRSFPLVEDWTEYPINEQILGGGTLTLTVTLQALAPGAYSGEVSVWIEGDLLGMDMARARRETIEFEVQ